MKSNIELFSCFLPFSCTSVVFINVLRPTREVICLILPLVSFKKNRAKISMKSTFFIKNSLFLNKCSRMKSIATLCEINFHFHRFFFCSFRVLKRKCNKNEIIIIEIENMLFPGSFLTSRPPSPFLPKCLVC